MLTRRIVAGPSTALLKRLQTSAAAEAADPLAAARALKTRTDAAPEVVPKFSSSAAKVDRLLNLAASTDLNAADRGEAWRIYRGMSPAQRAGLSNAQLRMVLRSIVPQNDEAMNVANNKQPRDRFAYNRKTSLQWEARLRSVMADLVKGGGATSSDWIFVLQALSKLGYVSACESVVRDMPGELRSSRVVIEHRLGAIIRWARDLRATGSRPVGSDVDIAYNAFWEVFRGIQQDNVPLRHYTLRLLLSAIDEIAGLVASLDHDDSVSRLDNMMRLVLRQGYGIDLDNLAASTQERSTDSKHPALSAKGLHAVLSYLSRTGMDPYRLLSSFELLVAHPRASTRASAARNGLLENEDEDDFVPNISGMTTAEEHGSKSVVWPTSGDASASGIAQAQALPAAPQGPRSVQDFLASTLPTFQAPESTVQPPLPSKAPYTSDTILVLLQSARASENLNLFLMILETALADAKNAQSEWLAAYVSCPPESRQALRRPVRINPEWFRLATAFLTDQYGRNAARLSRSIESALGWIDQEIEIIVQNEDCMPAEGDPAAAEGPALPTVPIPSFAVDPRSRRKLRSLDIFLVSEALESLHRDRTELRRHLERSRTIEIKRRQRHDARSARRLAAQATARTTRSDSSPAVPSSSAEAMAFDKSLGHIGLAQ